MAIAGLGLYGRFETIPCVKKRAMLAVDIDAAVHLTKLLVPQMVARGRGYVLDIASIAAYQPSPLYTTYAAAKAFVLSFSEALRFELRESGVSVTCLSPGVTVTEFLIVAKHDLTSYRRLTRMTSEAVVRAGVDALFARRGSVVPGRLKALAYFTTRLTSRPLLARIAYALMKSTSRSIRKPVFIRRMVSTPRTKPIADLAPIDVAPADSIDAATCESVAIRPFYAAADSSDSGVHRVASHNADE